MEQVIEDAVDSRNIEADKKNRDFVMLYRREKAAMLDLGKQDPTASVLLNFLILNMDTDNCLIVSGETIAEYLEWSLRTVRSKIKVLYDLRLIDILKSGNTNIYCVNANVAWSTYANKRQYAKFQARVMISKSEQEANRRIRNSRTKRFELGEKK